MWRTSVLAWYCRPASFSASFASAMSCAEASSFSFVSRAPSQQAAQVATTSCPGRCDSASAKLRAFMTWRASSPEPAYPIEAPQQFQSGMGVILMPSESHIASTLTR